MVKSRTVIRGAPRGCPEKLSIPLHNDNVPLLDSVNNQLGVILKMVDQTHHAMSEFIQIQKMESMEYLARGLSHDLATGLMSLQSNIYLLEKANRQSELSGRIESIRKISENMEGLVKKLDMLGEEDAGYDLSYRDFNLEIRQVMDSLVPALKSNINLHFQVCDTPLTVLLCQGDLWRIIANLMDNACEAMPNGGDLLVSTKLREVDGVYCCKHGNARKGIFAVMSICDHGKGIPTRDLCRIFDPLFSTKKDMAHPGRHGWGLAIVYSLINRRGGWIDVRSIEGAGTTFEIYLPLAVKGEK